MPRNIFQKHKTQKYANPIPSRESILEYLNKREKPAKCEELVVELKIKGEKQSEELQRLLRAMERDGQLVFTRHQRYALPEHLNLVIGTVIGHRDGFGFLRVIGRKDDLYLSSTQMKMCIHGDQILAKALKSNRKGRYEAKVIRVLVPKINQIIGRYFTNAGISFVVPDDSRLNFNIFIPPENILGTETGIVVVELIKRPTKSTQAIGKIIEVLGSNMDTNMAINIALRTHEIPYIWPLEVKNQIKKLEITVSEKSKLGRVDLRHLLLMTIDSEDAYDFDDAVYCEKKRNGGWRLWVAVADVSYYIRANTPLDDEARNRGTSIYFPSQVVPMLPEIFSNGICSLNPQVDRLCMVCEMTISNKGYLTSYKFYEGIMNSYARLTYTKVWHILQGDQKLRKQYAPLIKHIDELYNLYKTLDKARQKRGGISFESEEAKFIFNSDGRIQHIEQKQRNDAHKLIEECMILANISAARFVEQAKEPSLFRIHDKPTTEAVIAFRAVLSELGLKLSGGNTPEVCDYAKLLESIVKRPDAEMLQTMLLRTMKQAIYDPKNRGHFGLALQSYAHFTSPIRRYPDLLLHRSIKYLLMHSNEEAAHNQNTRITGGWHYTVKEMLHLAQHCSMTERRADEATREVSDWLKCDYMLNQVGNIFKGVIVNVTSFGFFVRLDKLSIDGLVHVCSLNDDDYKFDQAGQRLVGEFSGQSYRLGDRVYIRVKTVNLVERKIDFCLITGANQSNYTNKINHKKKKV